MCDGHMSVLKKKLRLADLGKAGSVAELVSKAVRDARGTPVFAGPVLPLSSVPEVMVVPYMTARHELYRGADRVVLASGKLRQREHTLAPLPTAAPQQKRAAVRSDPVTRAEKKQRLTRLANPGN